LVGHVVMCDALGDCGVLLFGESCRL
jgi:hypothetical protein